MQKKDEPEDIEEIIRYIEQHLAVIKTAVGFMAIVTLFGVIFAIAAIQNAGGL